MLAGPSAAAPACRAGPAVVWTSAIPGPRHGGQAPSHGCSRAVLILSDSLLRAAGDSVTAAAAAPAAATAAGLAGAGSSGSCQCAAPAAAEPQSCRSMPIRGFRAVSDSEASSC